MATKTEVKNLTLRNSADLCKLAEMMGYGERFQQLQCKNGAFVSSLLEMLDDNSGMIEAIHTFITDNMDTYVAAGHIEDDEETEEEDDENPLACPGCGCTPGDGITESCNDPHGCGESKLRRSESSRE